MSVAGVYKNLNLLENKEINTQLHQFHLGAQWYLCWVKDNVQTEVQEQIMPIHKHEENMQL